jgi:putative flippase GtrA
MEDASLGDATPSDAFANDSTFATLLRHQAGAVAATAVDFVVMVVAVSVLGASAPVGTAFGAALGAITNFTLGRSWIFDARHGTVRGQGLRYALVAAGSLGLNVAGVAFASGTLGVQYVGARVFVSLAVGILWNFPLHKHFVFGGRK